MGGSIFPAFGSRHLLHWLRPGLASGYNPRIADAELRACLAAAGAVVIEGPKACGKTCTAQQLAASTVLLDVAPPLARRGWWGCWGLGALDRVYWSCLVWLNRVPPWRPVPALVPAGW